MSSRLFHGGVPDLRVGDLIEPGHSRREHDGCRGAKPAPGVTRTLGRTDRPNSQTGCTPQSIGCTPSTTPHCGGEVTCTELNQSATSRPPTRIPFRQSTRRH